MERAVKRGSTIVFYRETSIAVLRRRRRGNHRGDGLGPNFPHPRSFLFSLSATGSLSPRGERRVAAERRRKGRVAERQAAKRLDQLRGIRQPGGAPRSVRQPPGPTRGAKEWWWPWPIWELNWFIRTWRRALWTR